MTNNNSNNNFVDVRNYAIKFKKSNLHYNAAQIKHSKNYYVAWIDIMGSGHVMTTSIQKSANFLARLHLSIEKSQPSASSGAIILPINDGVFIVSEKRNDISYILGISMIHLALNFIATPDPANRFLVRGGIAYGPMFFGNELISGLSKRTARKNPALFDNVALGPPLIHAYTCEHEAPPFGISVHESARSFVDIDGINFKSKYWMWWSSTESTNYLKSFPSLISLKDCLLFELQSQFDWMSKTLIYHGITINVIERWKKDCEQYLFPS